MIELISNKIFLDDDYEIREYDTENGIVRALVCDGCTQSMIYVDDDKRSKLSLDYFEYYNIPVKLNPNGDNYLMLGGGGFSYPHYFLNKYKNKSLDVVEINPECIEYAKKYFYLDELLKNNNDRINIIIDDAINYIVNCNKKYDYILIDLFKGKTPIKEIYSKENIGHLRKILNSNGVIVINYIITNGDYNEELNRITRITTNNKIIANDKYFNKLNKKGNIIIILSNDEISL